MSGGRRGLKVTGHAGTDYPSAAKTSCTFAAIDRRTASNELAKWSAKEKLKVEKRIFQGALSAAEVRAAKLAAIERNEDERVGEAEREVQRITAEVVNHVRRTSTLDTVDRTSLAIQFLAWRNSRHNRKVAAAVSHAMKALRTELFSLTKSKVRRRYRAPKRFLKASEAVKVISIVQQLLALKSRHNELFPPVYHEVLEMYVSSFQSRPRIEYGYNHDHYNRKSLAYRLREARATIAAFTPPPDSEPVPILPARCHPCKYREVAA
jgi:hypothetical protein